MTKYTDAALAAHKIAESGDASALVCAHPSNNLVYWFLREACSNEEGSAHDGTELLTRNFYKAQQGVKECAYRICDPRAALTIKGVGPSIAKILDKNLFSEYPQESLTDEEKLLIPKTKAAPKTKKPAPTTSNAELATSVTAVPPKRRGRPSKMSGDVHSIPASSRGAPEASLPGSSAPPNAPSPPPKPRSSRPIKPYVPSVGSANYAFLVVMFAAHRGPERILELSKADILDRAEQSGLADRSVFGDGAPAAVPSGGGSQTGAGGGGRGRPGPQHYSGWSSFNALLVQKHGLATARSNPKLCSLTLRGLEVAEKLYQHALDRGAVSSLESLAREGAGAASEVVLGRASAGARQSPKRTPLASPRPRPAPLPPAPQPASTPVVLYTPAPQAPARTEERAPRGSQCPEVVDLVTPEPPGQDGELGGAAGRDPSPGPAAQDAPRAGTERRKRARADALRTLSPWAEEGDEELQTSEPALSSACSPRRRADADAAPGPFLRCLSSLSLPPLLPGASFATCYRVVALVDTREHFGGISGASRGEALRGHMDSLRARGLRAEERTLPVGDVVWVARATQAWSESGAGPVDPGTEFVLDWVLERKSVIDLLASIRGRARFATQKKALAQCGRANVLFLLEGDVDALPNASDQKAIKTSMAECEFVHGFHVLRTRGYQDTFRHLQILTQAIEARCRARPSSGALPPGECPTWAEFVGRVAAARREVVTLQDTWTCMLGTVSGVGPEAARAVAGAYPTPRALHLAYAACGSVEQKRALLADVAGRGRTARRVGAEVSRRVFDDLFAAPGAPASGNGAGGVAM